MSDYRFKFAHGAKKAVCPQCGQRTLRPYVDTHTGQMADEQFGACDRAEKCAYFRAPTGFAGDSEEVVRDLPPPKQRITSWRCPSHVIDATKNSAGNRFAIWLVGILGQPAVDSLRMYQVGTYPPSERNPHLEGSVVYWQIGTDGMHRSGKIMQYDDHGHRRKDIKGDWVHSVVYQQSMEELGIGQVLFGTHLLRDRPFDTVCLVEAEKTAIIASAIYPQYVWLATGGSSMFSVDMCMVLSGRNVIVFPDCGQYEDVDLPNNTTRQGWLTKSIDIGIICESMVVSDVLEAMGAEPGTDIADYLLMWDGTKYVNYFDEAGVALFPQQDPPDQEPVEPPTEKQKQIAAWTDILAGASVKSPVDRILEMPGVASLVRECNIDTEKVSVKVIKDGSNEQ